MSAVIRYLDSLEEEKTLPGLEELRLENARLKGQLAAEINKTSASRIFLARANPLLLEMQETLHRFDSKEIDFETFRDLMTDVANILGKKYVGEIAILDEQLKKKFSPGREEIAAQMDSSEVDEAGLMESNASLEQLFAEENLHTQFGRQFVHNANVPMTSLMCWLELAASRSAVSPQKVRDEVAAGLGEILMEKTLFGGHMKEEPIEVCRFNPKAALIDVVKDYEKNRCEHEQKLSVQFYGVPDEVMCVPNVVISAVKNFLRNAIHLSSRDRNNPTHITVAVSWDKSDGLTVAVTDTGPGYDPAQQSQLFQFGSQLTNQNGGKKTGHGIGLSSVKNLANSVGGDCDSHSDGFGKGATFWIAVPAPLAAKPKPAMTSSYHFTGLGRDRHSRTYFPVF